MSLLRLPLEVQSTILESCTDASDALALGSTCKQLAELWAARGAGVVWSLWTRQIPAVEEALISLRAAQFVHDQEARKQPLPMAIDVAQFSSAHKRPGLADFNGLWAQILMVRMMAKHIIIHSEARHGEHREGLEEPEHQAECEARVQMAIYRTLTAAAAIAGLYNAPMYTEYPIYPDDSMGFDRPPLTLGRDGRFPAERLRDLLECPAFRMPVDREEEEKMFGAFAVWLRDNILADQAARQRMAQHHQNKTGRGLCCVCNLDYSHSDGEHSSDDSSWEPECALADVDGLQHSDTHLLIWHVMQMLRVQGRIQRLIALSPIESTPNLDPPAHRTIPVVFFNQFQVREVHLTKNPPRMDLRPTTHSIVHRRRPYSAYTDVFDEGNWTYLLYSVVTESDQPNTYRETGAPTTPLELKLFDYLLWRLAGARFPLNYFQYSDSELYADYMTFVHTFTIFASDEVESRAPVRDFYFGGDFADGSEFLLRAGQQEPETYNKVGD
ncbi:hypothetical protein A9K55_006826 [Cordyceps militaris]|uniref:F-box domain-containing protein n=1 Tax=Cordyceps militaris TaxID=73501 RepID=A0A2H4SDD7_CORMI|nr:hypothetical protein A9K55_006826 [Cordyceps militaris]